jgi:hypothetical protein
MKDKYIKPSFEIRKITLKDCVCASPENYNQYLESEPADWGDPIIDPDDPIDW